MLFIRQGATHRVVVGPAVAVGDGFTPVTTLALSSADEAEVILHDNGTVVSISGYTWAAITTADGYYHLTLQSDITNTVGHMTVVINDDSLCLPIRQDFTIVEEAVYDQFYAASAPGAATVAIGSDIHSSLVIVKSDLVISNSDTTAIHTQTTTIASDLVQVYSDTTRIDSNTVLAETNISDIESSLVIIKSDLVVHEAMLSDIESSLVIVKSDLVIIGSDTAAIEAGGGSLTATQASQLARIQSDVIIAQSDIIIIGSDTAAIEAGGGSLTATQASQLARVQSDVIVLDAAVSDVESSLVIAKSDLVLLTAPRDGTAGAYPELGIVDQGTAQSATATTLVLRAATPLGSDDAANGMLLLVHGSTQGYWQSRAITDYTTADDTATVDTWDVTPSGTITYKVFGTAAGSSSGLTATQSSQLTRIQSDLIIAQSDLIIIGSDLLQVYSDTTIIYSDTTRIHSDLILAEAAISDVESSLVIVKSDLVISNSDTTAIHLQTTTIASDLVQVYSDTTRIDSNTVLAETNISDIESSLVIIKSDLVVHEAMLSDIESSLVIVKSDLVISNSDTTAIQTKTDSLTFTTANMVDAAVKRVGDTTLTAAGTGGQGYGA